jgi:hypothetical protein
MTRAKPGPVQIRLTLLDAEGLSSRVKTESIQYEFMMAVISSLRTEGGKNKWHHIVSPDTQGYSYFVVNHDYKVVQNLFSYNSCYIEQ